MDSGPLVSVIIRSLGRPSLAPSVESVLVQTHRPIEIVIVDAGSNGLPPLPWCSGVECRIVRAGALNRPRAANAGLAAARGEWLIFLDDDDAFLPGHIESLVRQCTEQPDVLVAYSATSCVDDAGIEVDVLAKAFDRLKLFERNYIQIGAALFNRRIVLEGYRFDESFESLQDWDFWIQLAQRTRFAYTGEATNRWSAFSGGSGSGRGANSDPARYVAFRERIARKWTPLFDDLRRMVIHHQTLAKVAAERGHLDASERHLAAADAIASGAPPKARLPALAASTRRKSRVTM
ncbi:MAG: glycosyltransferase [Usitatibacter sp.]